jgi:hypothetical protein
MSAPTDLSCNPLPENFFLLPLHHCDFLDGMDLQFNDGLQYTPLTQNLSKPYWESVHSKRKWEEDNRPPSPVHRPASPIYLHEVQEDASIKEARRMLLELLMNYNDSSSDCNGNTYVNNTYNTVNNFGNQVATNSTWKPHYTKPWTNSDLAKVGAYSTAKSTSQKVYESCYRKQDAAWAASIKSQGKWKK